MVEPTNRDLPVGKQCKLLSISRSSFYYTPKLSAAQVHALVLEGKTVVRLSEGMELHRSRVMGANRIEFSGFSEAEGLAQGRWLLLGNHPLEASMFCPTDADGVAILDRLLARCLVARLHDRGGC